MRDVSAEQRARARHLDTKTGTLAGFAATALTLNATLGRPLLSAEASSNCMSTIRAFFVVSVVALALAVLIAVGGVLRPMGHADLDEDAIDGYSDRPKVTTDPQDLRMTWLRTVTEITKSDRKVGNAKSLMATISVLLLAIGVLGVVGEALTLVYSQ